MHVKAGNGSMVEAHRPRAPLEMDHGKRYTVQYCSNLFSSLLIIAHAFLEVMETGHVCISKAPLEMDHGKRYTVQYCSDLFSLLLIIAYAFLEAMEKSHVSSPLAPLARIVGKQCISFC